MAIKNKTIRNPVTKQDITFLQTSKDTGGQLLEMETVYHAFSKEPALHYHPFQAEDFTVLSGELTVRIEGRLKVLKAGEILHIAKNQVHSMWNNWEGKTVVNWKVQPALNTEYLLETIFGLANDGNVNKNGLPNILQLALIANKYTDELRLSKPPMIVQKTIFSILEPFAYLFGYKPVYKQYFD